MNQLLAGFILALIVFVSSLPVVAVDPEAEENGAAASGTATAVAAVDASPQSPLESLPLEIHFKIFKQLSPKEVNSVALTSKVMSERVSGFRAHCRETYQAHVKAAMRAHESNPEGYGLPMFATPKSNIEKNIDSDILKHLSPQQVKAIWAGFFNDRELFAATTNSPLYEIADRMENYQKANMADVMLAAMYSVEAPPSYLEKAAIHHLFSSYTVFHKEEGNPPEKKG